jgi:hypothetical protein
MTPRRIISNAEAGRECHIVDKRSDEGGHTTHPAISVKSFIKEFLSYILDTRPSL